MSIKTFKSANSNKRTLGVGFYNGKPNIIVDDGDRTLGVIIATSDAPALALAILEAAQGANEECDVNLHEAIVALRTYVVIREADAKEAADRAALEADAWTLYESAFPEDHPYPSLDRFPEHLRDAWIRVALKAREMKGAGDE